MCNTCFVGTDDGQCTCRQCVRLLFTWNGLIYSQAGDVYQASASAGAIHSPSVDAAGSATAKSKPTSEVQISTRHQDGKDDKG
jgi:hypothetical protein